MTIALGILCSDGLVMGADTQVTIPAAYLKAHASKIRIMEFFASQPGTPAKPQPQGALAVTGAGNTHYLEDFQDRLIGGVTLDPFPVIEKSIELIFRRFYKRTVLPLAHTAYPPDINILIGLQKDGNRQLWSTEGLSFTRNKLFGAVGAGAGLATVLLSKIYPIFPTVDIGKLLLIYALMYVKDRVDGCSGHSVVVTLKDNGECPVDRRK